MEDCYYRRKNYIPAFGNWEWNGDLPFTQCFESSRQAEELLHYSYSSQDFDRDLYVEGDLYQNDVVTPAMIFLPRSRTRKCEEKVKETKKEGWVTKGKVPPRPHASLVTQPPPPPPKPVDEDLYKISPELLFTKSKKKRGGLNLFLSCFA